MIATEKNNFLPEKILFLVLSLVYLCFSFYYAHLRLYGDAAYYLFRVVNEENFYIVHNRPASVLIEWIPVLLAKSGCNLELIIYCFSIGESLIWIGCAGLILLKWKDFNLANCLLLIPFIGIRYNYFNPVSELILAIPISFVLMKLLGRQDNSRSVWIIIGVMILFLFLSHALFAVILLFLGLIYLLDGKLSRSSLIKLILISAGSVLIYYFSMDEYDRLMIYKGMEGVEQESDFQLKQSYGPFMFQLQIHIGLMVMVAWLLISLIYKRQWRFTLFFMFFTCGYLAYIILTKHSYFPDTMEPFERYSLPFTVMVLIMFYSFVKFNGRWGTFLLLAIVCYQSIQLSKIALDLECRHQQLVNVLDVAKERGLSKVVVDSKNFNPFKMGHDWLFGTESLLISSARYQHTSIQMLVRESVDNAILENGNDSQFIEYPWWMLNSKILNKRYFNLDLQKFTYLNSISHVNGGGRASSNVGLSGSVEPLLNSSAAGRKWIGFLLLQNTGKDTIYSAYSDDCNYIFSKWYADKSAQEVMKSDTMYILADLLPSMKSRQLIKFNLPKQKGDYSVKYYLKERESAIEYFIAEQNIRIN